MKLDRNLNEGGRGKYALLKLRELENYTDPNDPFGEVSKPISDAIKTLVEAGILDWGQVGTESEFFLIRLKDQFAQPALRAYAAAASRYDPEYGSEITEMAYRSGALSPFCKMPD